MIPPTKAVLDATAAETDVSPDAPMTDKQAVILRELCNRAGEPMDAELTELQAEKRIAALKEVLGDT